MQRTLGQQLWDATGRHGKPSSKHEPFHVHSTDSTKCKDMPARPTEVAQKASCASKAGQGVDVTRSVERVPQRLAAVSTCDRCVALCFEHNIEKALCDLRPKAQLDRRRNVGWRQETSFHWVYTMIILLAFQSISSRSVCSSSALCIVFAVSTLDLGEFQVNETACQRNSSRSLLYVYHIEN